MQANYVNTQWREGTQAEQKNGEEFFFSYLVPKLSTIHKTKNQKPNTNRR